ncbi:MAG TPA: T9SS type A sorting domain-containing protein [Bacteroidetes bacterium]|nr:T9SS type A sorting domain-containing protein [Bacteroidota bacterium]
MNKKLHFFLVMAFTFLGSASLFAQCAPGDSLSCPDPEGNGQICPDTLEPAFIAVPYHQEITFIAPVEIDTLGMQVTLDHVTLVSVDGLPEGIDWQTNAENNEFTAGIYYCILFSGTTNGPPGNYPLKIVVDVYGIVLNQVVKLMTTEDSTSLSMVVKWDPNTISEYSGFFKKIWPNPFNDVLNIELAESITTSCQLEVYNLLGNPVYQKTIPGTALEKKLQFDGSFLPGGIYFIRLKYNGHRYTGMVYKRE